MRPLDRCQDTRYKLRTLIGQVKHLERRVQALEDERALAPARPFAPLEIHITWSDEEDYFLARPVGQNLIGRGATESEALMSLAKVLKAMENAP